MTTQFSVAEYYEQMAQREFDDTLAQAGPDVVNRPELTATYEIRGRRARIRLSDRDARRGAGVAPRAMHNIGATRFSSMLGGFKPRLCHSGFLL